MIQIITNTFRNFPSLQSDIADNLALINHNKDVCSEANEIIQEAHEKFSSVFDKDLKRGYNGFYGKHLCRLNWASSERPPASKVRVPSYEHELKSLQQELMVSAQLF